MMRWSLWIALFASGAVLAAEKEKNSAPYSKKMQECEPTAQECMGRAEPLERCNAGYNAPATIDVRPKWGSCSHDATVFFDLSFLYWYAGEEGLALAETGALSGGTIYYAENTHTLFPSFDYKPGFKVGAGLTLDHEWTVFAEYTWFRGTDKTTSDLALGTINTAGTAAALTGTNVWVVNDWFLQGTSSAQALAGSLVSSKWQLAMDLIDALLSRPFYEAKRLIISPFGGLQVALIRQWMDVYLTENGTLFPGVTPIEPLHSYNHSSSWGIGPKMGLKGEYLMPKNFRVQGDLAASLLYTSYDVTHKEDRASTAFNAGPFTASYSDYTALRTALELGLGLGWGSYLYGNSYHIDFSAQYDFLIFWSQNMMRKLLDDTLTGTGPSAADLYLHGLTIKTRFDF